MRGTSTQIIQPDRILVKRMLRVRENEQGCFTVSTQAKNSQVFFFFFEEPGIDLLWMRKKIGVGGGGYQSRYYLYSHNKTLTYAENQDLKKEKQCCRAENS